MHEKTKPIRSWKGNPGPGMYETIRENNTSTKFSVPRGIRGDFTHGTLKNRCDWGKLIDPTPGPGYYEGSSVLHEELVKRQTRLSRSRNKDARSSYNLLNDDIAFS